MKLWTFRIGKYHPKCKMYPLDRHQIRSQSCSTLRLIRINGQRPRILTIGRQTNSWIFQPLRNSFTITIMKRAPYSAPRPKSSSRIIWIPLGIISTRQRAQTIQKAAASSSSSSTSRKWPNTRGSLCPMSTTRRSKRASRSTIRPSQSQNLGLWNRRQKRQKKKIDQNCRKNPR